MGLFYQSVTVQGPTHSQLLRYLQQRQRSAWLSPTINGMTSIFDDDMSRDRNVARRFERPAHYRPGVTGWEPVVRELSAHIHCVLFAAEVYDGDYFYYQLYDDGVLIDEYVSDVDPFGTADEVTTDTTLLRQNDHAAALCAAFNAGGAESAVVSILANGGSDRPEIVHEMLIQALGLSLDAWSGRPPAYANREIGGRYISTLWHPVEPRPLDAWERGLLERILALPIDGSARPGVEEIRRQMVSAVVFEETTRNIGVGIVVEQDPANRVPGAPTGHIMGLSNGTDSDGMTMWANVWTTQGYLSGLTVRRADSMAFTHRPDLERFR